MFCDWARENRIELRPVMELENFDLMVQSVSMGMGVALIPRRCFGTFREDDGWDVLLIVGSRHPAVPLRKLWEIRGNSNELGLIGRCNRGPSAAAADQGRSRASLGKRLERFHCHGNYNCWRSDFSAEFFHELHP